MSECERLWMGLLYSDRFTISAPEALVVNVPLSCAILKHHLQQRNKRLNP